ncbi:cobalamin biosynthesis protein CobW [Magnetospirillum aberrantis]|uniref:Cobalamin biosynthesis protein CobW n=1 Tax=Magnetospirillum aberrantis SpK TaxID=908842 RepID=A0A7C9USD0_9PROT|nr:cobalamin biosynthesis protein CobW [Magnetospirillum aberrantis]NFV78806.1 cobalamin biosynthesis protein CobW [Magnetospirillum aberrantis SpK]
MRKIPTTIITGFLGAGKSTLVRHLMEHNRGRRIALIVNEFGDVGIDGNMLASCGVAGCTEDSIIELANGCLCCTVADEFLPVMQALVERANPPEHILIETSGLALPKPLVKAFHWPEIRSRVTVDGVVAVIDAEAAASGRFTSTPEEMARPDHDNPLEEVFDDQLTCADMVLLNKVDLVDADGLDRAQARMADKLRPGVKVVATRHSALDPVVVLGLDAGAEDDLDTRPSLHDSAADHDHDDFESFAVALPEVADLDALAERLRRTIADHDILRLKGFVAVQGKAARHVIQAVGARLDGYYDRPWGPGEDRKGHVVVIGRKGLAREDIAARVQGDASVITNR